MIPALRTHDRSRPVETVSAPTVGALVKTFTEAGAAPSAADIAAVQLLLRELRTDELWLECDCRTEGDDHPLLSPRQLPDRLTLVRHGRVLHAEACPFFRLRDKQVDQNALVAPPPVAAEAIDAIALAGRDLPRLGALLLGLLERCGYHRVTPAEFKEVRSGQGDGHALAIDVPRHYARVDAVSDLEVAPGVALGQVWCNHLAGVGALRARLARMPNAVTGLFIGIIDSAEGKRLVARRRDALVHVDVDGEIHRYTRAQGPYWAIAEVRAQGEAAAVGDVYLHPVLSRALLLPVDTDAERGAAELLLQQIRYWNDRRSTPITLSKPLMPDGNGARPDFLLSRRDGDSFAVEVMPIDPDFEVRDLKRAVARDVARSFEHVVEIGAGEDRDLVRKRLTAAALRGLSAPPTGPAPR